MTRIVKTVTFNLTDKGLGISIIGNVDNNSGIFVKFISPGGLASRDGRLREGDQIISINGEDLEGVSCNDAVKLLKNASEDGFVQLKICHDYQARQQYKEICEMYSFSERQSPELGIKNNDLQNPFVKDFKMIINIADDIERGRVVNDTIKVNLERLLQSLTFLGIALTKEEEVDLKNKLSLDNDGSVAYNDFINLAKDLHSQRMMKDDTFEKSQPKSNERSHLFSSNKRDDPVNFQLLLNQKNETILILEKEILKHKNELYATRDELKNVKSKLMLSEQAQQAARKTEQDYELVLKHLESDGLKALNTPEPRQDIELMRLQLKKAETSNKLLRTANEKLIDFTIFVADALKKRKEQINVHEALKSSISSPIFLDFSSSDRIILSEADQTIRAVKTLLDMEAQPILASKGAKHFYGNNLYN